MTTKTPTDAFGLVTQRAAQEAAAVRRRNHLRQCDDLERFAPALDALSLDQLAALADSVHPDGGDVMPGGSAGIAFRWYLRNRRRGRRDVTIRPRLLEAIADPDPRLQLF